MGGQVGLVGYWRGHVEGWRASGGTQRAYCERHGLKQHSLSYWHVRLARTARNEGQAVPLTLVPASLKPAGAAAMSAQAVLLTTPGGWRLEFAGLPPADWLGVLLGRQS